MKKLNDKFLWLSLLLIIWGLHGSTGYCGPNPNSGEFIHGMVKAAQLTFERGEKIYLAGDQQKAAILFDQSHHLLLAADQMGDESIQRRIDRVFEKFYRELADIDPITAKRYGAIRNQVHDTFNAQPVYAGQVQYYIDYLITNKRTFLENSFNRSYRYLPMIKKEFAAAGIPVDLAYMALIESGFRPDPTSHAGAKGLWQFIPGTARQYGLIVANGVDERTDPVKSTRAAARYLTYLYHKFNDWPLAVAAYNCGEGRVERLLKKENVATYWDLVEKSALPLETQRYVPSIIAVTLIAREPVAYGFNVD